ncbi:MAG: hypothetical protein M0P43_09390 [Arcobacteraceae bacterium]|nr:hypothetical protein [Arcobacteraceae bacterium]MDY0327887.1 flagellar hook capping FlgD N-terminal domain-containing protein [Arcobacteraceae bacterium]
MSSVSSVAVSSTTDAYGNSYTTAISNDSLDSSDFIELMLAELQNQDPTEPTDSSKMLSDQLQINTLQTNIAMTEAMQTLTSTFAQTAISSASQLIGAVVENGDTGDDGENIQYLVSSVEVSDDGVNLKAYEITDVQDNYYTSTFSSADDLIEGGQDDEDSLTITDSEGLSYTFDTYGKTYQELSDEINEVSSLEAAIFQTSDGDYQMSISNLGGSSYITQNGTNISFSKSQSTIVSSTLTVIPQSSVLSVS